MGKIKLFLGASILLLVSGQSGASLIGLTTSNDPSNAGTAELYDIDPNTGAATLRSELQPPYFSALSGLTYLDGKLYATGIFEPPYSLATASFGSIDPNTGFYTPLNQHGALGYELDGLAADESNNILYSIAQGPNRLLAITPSGDISEVGTTVTQGRGLAFNSRDGFLYSAEDRLDPDGVKRYHIFRIDPSTGVGSDVGSIGLLTLFSSFGMAYDPTLDLLFMGVRPLFDDGTFGLVSNLYSIDPYTASANLIGPTSFESGQFEITGLAFVPSPVPAPAAIWLFGTGLIGLIGFTRRRKAA